MVGPGEVDDELEPEIKEECNTKYGDVSKVMIYEIPKTTPEEAVRIFVEFKRVESAIKGKKKFKCLQNVTVLLDFNFFNFFKLWSTSMEGFLVAEKSEPHSTMWKNLEIST